MSQLNEEERAELVAYLDGELDEEASQVFEARLSRDRKLRAEAEALKKTWEMLDFLPRAEASPAFTHRTLERLALRDTAKVVAARPRRWAWLAPIGWAAAMLVAMVGGLLIANHLWPATSPAPPQDVELLVLQDQDLIRHLRLYRNAPAGIDDLRDLPGAFDDEDDEI